ncbi:MAG: DUF4258 domain-containing protein [Thermodesulfovibrionia bacterium]|nr:DUF4258 domain-containing protein [Thermodesulfovibrionia bacterium]
MDLIRRCKELVNSADYRLTFHAEIERDADCISIIELEEALTNDSCELIENYPDDQRGHSFLLLGFLSQNQPVHAVCSIHEDTLVIITVYRPDQELWINWRTRKEKK